MQVQVNRAPVITLWAAVVAQRQGHSRDAALTFGKFISGMLAQSKGRSIGIYEDGPKSEEEKAEAKQKEEEAGVQHVDVFGMSIKAVKVSLSPSAKPELVLDAVSITRHALNTAGALLA